ncbi:MAG TPA: hypothetical protein VFW05_04325 [Verrucomicrobiae bacterium]|nr:hypothetical protein [Verrucomicrobiae bacterium]
MKRILSLIAGGCGLALVSVGAPSQNYVNPAGNLVISPEIIDAVNFLNLGTFQLAGVPYIPYETFDTLNYTNSGLMVSAPGWRFDLNSNKTGKRSWSANFVNLNAGQIVAVDLDNAGSSAEAPCVVSTLYPSYLLVSATNIITQAGTTSSGASLVVGANGVMKLEGKKVDLSRSGLEVTPIWDEFLGSGVYDDPPTRFIPDVAVYDQVWAQSGFSPGYPVGSAGLWDGVTARAQAISRQQGANPAPFPGFTISNPTADSYVNVGRLMPLFLTNVIYEEITFEDETNGCSITVTSAVPDVRVINVRSNIAKGAVFVGVPASFNPPQIGFTGSTQPRNPFNRADVLISVMLSNSVTTELEPAYIRVQDQLASDTTIRGMLVNVIGCDPLTQRPFNYNLDRAPVLPGFSGNNGYPEPDFFLSSGNRTEFPDDVIQDSVTNSVVESGEFSAYTSYLDNIVTRPPAVPGGDITNMIGRVDITADVLNLERTRIRGEGLISIDTPHLVSSTNAVIDAENLSFNLGSTNGLLKVESMLPSSGFVQRLRGPVRLWSAVWSNNVTILFTNNYVLTNLPIASPCDTNGTIIGTQVVAIPLIITNQLGVLYHTLMVDATSLTTVVPVSVYDFKTHSPDVVVNDNLTLVRNLMIDGRSLTLNGSMTIPGLLQVNPVTGLASPQLPLLNWKGINAPNLVYFTNNGSLYIVNEAHFGDDRSLGYAQFINNGTLQVGSLNIKSDSFENHSDITSLFTMNVRSTSSVLANGSSTAGGGVLFFGNDLKLNQYLLSAVDAVEFNLTNSLADAGPGSGNLLQLANGFNLRIKPKTGDLLGTTVTEAAPDVPSVRIANVWAGEDFGPAAAGYSNNVAIGVLRFTSESPDPAFAFRGAGAHNAMYVDLLDLSALTDYANQLRIDNNLVIYFAAAELGFTPPPNGDGAPQQPEEYLDGQFGGRLRWVRTYAGANSGQSIVIDGVPTQVNKALFNSMIIDSDQDSIPNGSDPGPNVFQTAPVSVTVFGNGSANPNYDGVPLLLGEVYTITATPREGAQFLGWSGSLESSLPVLTFTNTGGLELFADFSFKPVAGTYNGLFYQSDGIQMFQSGYITIKTTKRGSYSGVARIGTERFPLSGRIDEDGHSFPNSSLAMELQFSDDEVTGTVDGFTWLADLQADRALVATKAHKNPYAGRYTILFPGGDSPTNHAVPYGDGYGTITVAANGKIRLSGSLPDGTRIAQSSSVGEEGQWPFYVPLYRGDGQAMGWMSFAQLADRDVGGTFNWIKLEGARGKFYQDGFNHTADAIGSRFSKTNSPFTVFDSGRVIFDGGNPPVAIENEIAISRKSRISNLGTNKLSMKISGQGVFKGKFVNPNTGRATAFSGVMLQKQGFGGGYFISTEESGKVMLEP